MAFLSVKEEKWVKEKKKTYQFYIYFSRKEKETLPSYFLNTEYADIKTRKIFQKKTTTVQCPLWTQKILANWV